MGFLWIFYWLALLASFLFSFYFILKKHYVSAALQCLLTTGFTYLSVQIGISSGYTGKGKTEFAYFLERLCSFKLDAILLVILLILIIGCNVYHIAVYQDLRRNR